MYLYINKNRYIIPEETSYLDTPFYNEISSSYIKNNVKGIINVIQALINLDVIVQDEAITRHANVFYMPESTTLANLLDFIREINIKELEKAKELIK